MASTSTPDIVIGLLQEFTGRRNVQETTRLYHDLSIAGDDAHEILERIHSQFGTSFRDLDFHKYFPTDADAGGYQLLAVNGFSSTRHPPITVGHLLKVIESGKWFDPPDIGPEADGALASNLERFKRKTFFIFREAFLFIVFPIAATYRGAVALTAQVSSALGQSASLPPWGIDAVSYLAIGAMSILGIAHLRYIRRVCDRFPHTMLVSLAIWVINVAVTTWAPTTKMMFLVSILYLALPLVLYMWRFSKPPARAA